METVIRMKPEYVKAIEDNPALMGVIAQVTNKSISTIERWCASNDSRLTMLSVINSVRDYLKLSKDSSITEHIKKQVA